VAEPLDELLVNVKLDVNDKEYEKLKKKVDVLKEEGAKVKSQVSGTSTSDRSPRDVVKLLQRSEKHLSDIVNLLKKSKGEITPEDNIEDTSETLAVAGGASLGGVGAAIGLALSGVAAGIVTLMESLQRKLTDKFERELDLQKLSQQTGKSVEQLYKLSAQAQLAGTTLGEIVSAGKNLQQELLFGMSEQKAMMLMALGINPIEIQKRSNFDPVKMVTDINKQIESRTGNVPAGLVTAIKSALGVPEGIQYGVSHLRDRDVVANAQRISETRGNIGSDEWRQNFVEFKTALLKTQAAIDKALSTTLVTQAVLKYMDVKAQAVTIVAGSIAGISESLTTPQGIANIKKTIGEVVPTQTSMQSYTPGEHFSNAWMPKPAAPPSSYAKFGGSQ
jgi:hypothetical protein